MMGAESKDPEDFYRTRTVLGSSSDALPGAAGHAIVAVVEALRNHPRLGHAGAEPTIRELVIGGTPYIVLYRVRAGG
jgi:hypothetical protein